MKYVIIFILPFLIFSINLFAKEPMPKTYGSATISIDGDTATWPVWNCRRVVLAHQLADDDILVDEHLKLIDYGDVIQLVLKLNDKNYVADMPGTTEVNNINFSGVATRIDKDTLKDNGEIDFTLDLQCAL